MRFIPYIRYSMKTYIAPLEVEMRLQQIVEPRKLRIGWSRNHLPFEGRVGDGRFKFSRIIHYRNSFLPVIVGDIKDDLDSTRIDITMRLDYLVLFLLSFIFLFTASMGLVAWVSSQNPLNDLAGVGLIPVGFILFFYGVIIYFFNYEVKKARTLIDNALT